MNKNALRVQKSQAKAGLISKSYKLPKSLVEAFASACTERGTSQAAQLRKLMEDYISQKNHKTP